PTFAGVQSDGHVVVLGREQLGSALQSVGDALQLSASGTFVTDTPALAGGAGETLGGLVEANDQVVGVGYQSNGSNEDLAIFRLQANFDSDDTFGIGGVTTVDLGSDARGYAVLRTPGGRYYVP